MARRALLIVNPAARNVPNLEKLRAAAQDLDGYAVEVALTEAAGHATELARAASSAGLDAVVACGGDGTVNEAANGLAGSETALLVIRGGTANVWAKETHTPRKPAKALRLLTEGEVRSVDLGRAGERYFLMLAGVGYDADVIRGVSSVWKRRIGAAAFLLRGIGRALRYRAVEANIEKDGKPAQQQLYWLLAGNTRNYGGLLQFAYRARIDDGMLDVITLRRGGLWRVLTLLPLALLKRHDRSRDVTYEQLRSVNIATPGLPVHLDGEYVGETPLRFEVVPRALRVITPRGLKDPLFGS